MGSFRKKTPLRKEEEEEEKDLGRGCPPPTPREEPKKKRKEKKREKRAAYARSNAGSRAQGRDLRSTGLHGRILADFELFLRGCAELNSL
jgi:hypothetical protein